MNTDDIIFNNEDEAWDYFYENYPEDCGCKDWAIAAFETWWCDRTEELEDGRILLKE